MKQDWFFTFGQGHRDIHDESLAYKFFRVPDATFEEARERIVKLRGPRWAFQYPVLRSDGISELDDQIARYGIESVDADQIDLKPGQPGGLRV
jgi:hypothetical protein